MLYYLALILALLLYLFKIFRHSAYVAYVKEDPQSVKNISFLVTGLMLVGMFTFQSFFFVILLFISLFLNKYMGQEYPKFLDIFYSIFLTFVILNAFFWKYEPGFNLFEKNWFKLIIY